MTTINIPIDVYLLVVAYKFQFIFSLWWRRKTRRWVPPLNTQCLQTSMVNENGVLTRFTLPTLLWAGYSAGGWSLIWTYCILFTLIQYRQFIGGTLYISLTLYESRSSSPLDSRKPQFESRRDRAPSSIPTQCRCKTQ